MIEIKFSGDVSEVFRDIEDLIARRDIRSAVDGVVAEDYPTPTPTPGELARAFQSSTATVLHVTGSDTPAAPRRGRPRKTTALPTAEVSPPVPSAETAPSEATPTPPVASEGASLTKQTVIDKLIAVAEKDDMEAAKEIISSYGYTHSRDIQEKDFATIAAACDEALS